MSNRIFIPPEKQCTFIKTDGKKCTNAKYKGGELCFQHSPKGLKKEVVQQKEGKLYRLTCDNCSLSDECPSFHEGEKCTYTAGTRAYDLDNPESYNKLLQKLIQMEVEAYTRRWVLEKETGEGGEEVSKRFMRLTSAMNEFKKNTEAEKAKKPQSIADLIKE